MFNPKNFNLLHDFTKRELEYLIDFSIHLKKLKKNNIPHEYLKGQNIALIFDKTSSRTRAAFVVATNNLGGDSETLVKSDIQFGKKESVEILLKFLVVCSTASCSVFLNKTSSTLSLKKQAFRFGTV